MKTRQFNISRRRFLRASAAVAAGSALPAWFIEESRSHAATTKPLSPNDKPNMALIGCGGQGRYDTTLAAHFATVAAVCDVDNKHAQEASKQFGGAKVYKDFRLLLRAKPGAFFKPAASSGATRGFGSPANWSATAAWANSGTSSPRSRPGRAGARSVPSRCRPNSTGISGRARPRPCPTSASVATDRFATGGTIPAAR